MGKDAECAAIMADGSHWGGRLGKLPKNLVNCTLILPPACGLGLQGGMLSLGDGDESLDVSTIEHKHHPARKRLIVPVDADVDEIAGDERIVFDRPVGRMRIVIVKQKVSRNGKKVLLSTHSQAVAEVAREFATKLGLDADVFESTGLHHDDGKANYVWQKSVGNTKKEPVAKGRVIAAKLAGFRHEFESIDASDGELEKHVIAAHHGGARPTWIGDRELSPQHIDEDKVYAQIIRFSGLQQKYGWWGLAYLEALLRCADAYVSGDE
jgi:CRISPR-associated helicase Cas3